MKRQPLLFCCLFFIAGILFYEHVKVSDVTVRILLAISFSGFLLHLFRNFFLFRLRNLSLFVFFFAFGVFMHSVNEATPKLPEFDRNKNFVFKITKKLNSNERNRRYETVVYQDEKSAASVLSVPKTEPEPDFKHYYRSKIYLNRTEPPANDFQFDYSKYLRRSGIYFQGFVPEGFDVAERKNLTFGEIIKQKRLEVLQKIDRKTMSPKTREFMKGIVLADRTEMDAETVRDWTKTGLVHILAISGSHIVIIFGIFLFVFRRLFPFRKKSFAIVCSLVFIWLFAVFIGYGNSVVRSCLMITVYFIYVLLQRKPDLLHSMSLAALIILSLDTQQLFDVGFQLSFIAVLGIFWLNQPVLKRLPEKRSAASKFMMNVFSISFAAQIATLPLVLYYFHQYSLVSIAANLVVIPFSEVAIILSLIMTLIIGLNFSCFPLEFIYDYFIQFLLKVIKFFSSVDFLYFENIPMSAVEAILLLIAIYFLRKIILKRDVESMLKFLTVILIFFGVRVGLNLYSHKKDEVFVASFFKEKLLISKKRDYATFYLKENTDREKVKKFIIDSYLNSRRISDFKVKIIPTDTREITIEGRTYQLK